MTTTNPNTWETPSWHPDFGNPAVEVEMLRAFSIKAIEEFPYLTTTLSTPEEGYLNVDIAREGRKLVEIYVVSDGNNRRFAIFGFEGESETEEQYFSEHEKGLAILGELLK